MTKLEEKVENLLKPIIEKLNYELYDVIYAKEAKDYYLKIFIDKKDGVSIDDCEIVSNSISDILDEADLIKEQYFLEVSSAGVERVLRNDKHLKDNIGKEVEVKLFTSVNKSKVYEGILKAFDENSLTIEKDDGEVRLERKNISVIKTIFKW
ncbi:MAG: ribosome maturation factor RimP [Clostridia bacterium]|nr:ribosome maturation factor RimP [Clostridia bacterium]